MIDRKVGRLTAKDLLRAGIVIGTILNPACGLDSNSQPIRPSPAPIATDIKAATSPTTIPQPYRLNEFSYQPRNRRPSSTGQFRTGQSMFEWLNFSDFTFNAQAAVSYFDALSQVPVNMPEVDIDIYGNSLRFKVEVRPNIARRFYLVRPTDPNPSWWANFPEDTTGITRTLERNDGLEEAVTLVKLFPQSITQVGDILTLANINQLNEWAFMTEACQSTLRLRGQNPQENRVAQESLCNTLGIAAAFRSMNADYQSFIKTLATIIIITPEIYSISIQLITNFPEKIYYQLFASRIA